MGGLFGGSKSLPSPPPPVEIPEPVKGDDPKISEARKRQRLAAQKMGRRKTILTGPQGLSSDLENSKGKTVLGR